MRQRPVDIEIIQTLRATAVRGSTIVKRKTTVRPTVTQLSTRVEPVKKYHQVGAPVRRGGVVKRMQWGPSVDRDKFVTRVRTV